MREQHFGSMSANRIGVWLILLAGLTACNKDTRLRIKASNGNPAALRELGEKMETGSDADFNQGIRLLKQAAEKGNTRAMLDLGALADSPPGLNPKALVWYQRGADAGDEICMYKVGEAYLYGQYGLNKDPLRSKLWFDKVEAIKRNRRGY